MKYRIIVISTEDSSSLDSWSNVPYMFCKTLRENQYYVIPFTIRENSLLRNIIFILRKFLFLITSHKTTWDYSRSIIHFYHARYQINKFCKTNEHDAILILSLSFGPSCSAKKPLFMFGDWSYGFLLEKKLNRKPDFFEKDAIKRENKLLKQADIVITHFLVAKDYINKILPEVKAYHIGTFINAIENPDKLDLVRKARSENILFIGKPHYIDGAKALLEAFKKIKIINPKLTLDIIGIERTALTKIPEGVTYHGYLSKSNDTERSKYYSLLRNASVFVNTNPKIASFSAALEAMYFYTPIIITKTDEMIDTFGERISFGKYFYQDEESLEKCILDLINSANYSEIAINAHLQSSTYSWDNFVKKFTKLVTNFSK